MKGKRQSAYSAFDCFVLQCSGIQRFYNEEKSPIGFMGNLGGHWGVRPGYAGNRKISVWKSPRRAPNSALPEMRLANCIK